MAQYFFILGKTSDLAFYELQTYLKRQISPDVSLIKTGIFDQSNVRKANNKAVKFKLMPRWSFRYIISPRIQKEKAIAIIGDIKIKFEQPQ